jgi:signal transduction histidine kinase
MDYPMPDRTPEELLTRFQNSNTDEFIPLLVHDLRGPLSGMISATRLINTLLADCDCADAAQLRELGQILHRTTSNMRAILDTAIEYDRIQRGESVVDEDD